MIRAILTLIAAAAVIFMLLLAIFWHPSPARGDEPVDAAIVFVVDVSDSMGAGERRVISQGHAQAIVSSEVLEAIEQGQHKRIAVAYVEFSTKAKVKVGWMVVEDLSSATSFAELVSGRGMAGGSTYISSGLAAALSLLRDLPHAADKLVVDVAGDGVSYQEDWPDLALTREAILATGATINGLPLMIEPAGNLEKHYLEKVVGGPAPFSLPCLTIADFPLKIRQKLLLELF